MAPAFGDGETLEEVIDVQLAGTVDQIESGINILSQIVARANRWQELAEVDRMYLQCRVAEQSDLCRSTLVGGRLELLKGADYRSGGSQGVRLHLVRLNWWEVGIGERELTPAGGTVIYNHEYGANKNAVFLFDTTIPMGAPLRVSYELLSAITYPATLYMGMQRYSRPGLDLFYRGADGEGTGGAVLSAIANGNSAGGSYSSLAWTSTGNWAMKRVWALSLSGAVVDALAGKAYKVMLKVPAGVTERTLCKIEVGYFIGGVVKTLWESDSFYIEIGPELQEGPTVFLPPWEVTGAYGSPDLLLYLTLGTSGAGAKTFKLDYLGLLPLDGWRICRPYLKANGANLVDDSYTGLVRNPAGVMTHTSEGPGGFALGAQENAGIYFYLAGEAAPQIAHAQWQARVHVYVRDRRAAL